MEEPSFLNAGFNFAYTPACVEIASETNEALCGGLLANAIVLRKSPMTRQPASQRTSEITTAVSFPSLSLVTCASEYKCRRRRQLQLTVLTGTISFLKWPAA